jgi:DNA-binding transcriptional MocR family regulator
MPYRRRVALLDWAARADAWIVEDDYDSEFRFAGRPLEALKALDEQRRVLYVATCSKVMFPALRIGYAVVPPALVEPLVRAKAIADGGSPVLEQDALADFIGSGDFERHLRRSRTRIGARRAALLAALEHELGDAVEVCGANAGMHSWRWLRDVPAAQVGALCRAAAEVGVGLYPVSPFYEAPPPRADSCSATPRWTNATFASGWSASRDSSLQRRQAGRPPEPPAPHGATPLIWSACRPWRRLAGAYLNAGSTAARGSPRPSSSTSFLPEMFALVQAYQMPTSRIAIVNANSV